MGLVDTHCHLYHDFGGKTPELLIRDAGLAGVEALITIGVDSETNRIVREISEKHPNVFFAAGFHPHEASELKAGDLSALEEAARHPKCVAIGELGLDYHYDFSPRGVQQEVFRAQLELALKLNKPVVVHCREAEADVLQLLREYVAQITDGRPGGVLHCFTGTREFGEACLELGFYISFSGVVTFKNSDDLRASARAYPLDRLLVETDAPYLAPIPYRGKKCEPAMVVHTALKLAELRGLSLAEVAQLTTRNAKRLFGILAEPPRA